VPAKTKEKVEPEKGLARAYSPECFKALGPIA